MSQLFPESHNLKPLLSNKVDSIHTAAISTARETMHESSISTIQEVGHLSGRD